MTPSSMNTALACVAAAARLRHLLLLLSLRPIVAQDVLLKLKCRFLQMLMAVDLLWLLLFTATCLAVAASQSWVAQ